MLFGVWVVVEPTAYLRVCVYVCAATLRNATPVVSLMRSFLFFCSDTLTIVLLFF